MLLESECNSRRGGAEGDYNKTSREKIDEYLELSSFLPIFAGEIINKTKNRYGNNKEKNTRGSPCSLQGFYA